MLEINTTKRRAFCMYSICGIRPGAMTLFVMYSWHTSCAIATNVTYIRGIRPESVKALRKAGSPISSAVILATVEGIITMKNRCLVACDGRHIKLKKSWAKYLISRYPYQRSRSIVVSLIKIIIYKYNYTSFLIVFNSLEKGKFIIILNLFL